jgi:hypothetical protein
VLRRTVREAAAAPVWEVSDPSGVGPGAGYDLWRFNAALRFARDTGRYPYSLEVVVPLAAVGPHGQPGADKASLADIEDEVVAIISDQAVLVGVLTSRDEQRLVFYTGSADWAERLQGELRGATGVSALRVNCDRDLHWFEYRSFRKMRDFAGPETFRLIGLCAATAVATLVVFAADGGAWWLVELAAGDIVAGSRWMRGNGLLRSPAPGWTRFAGSALAVAAVAFAVLGVAGLPAWLALVISLPAGCALTPAVRAARTRRWRPGRPF